MNLSDYYKTDSNYNLFSFCRMMNTILIYIKASGLTCTEASAAEVQQPSRVLPEPELEMSEEATMLPSIITVALTNPAQAISSRRSPRTGVQLPAPKKVSSGELMK